MEIERVNDYTVKFFISYRDIEDRGFDREEIWYDRERGEELFWEMMDEATSEGDFELDGPLWIQVQAFEKGLEIIVTKAKLSQDGSKLELPITDDKDAEITIEYQAQAETNDEQLQQQENGHTQREVESDIDRVINENNYLIKFDDFEDVIRLAHAIPDPRFKNDLYVLENVYYVYISFAEAGAHELKRNQLSALLEFGSYSNITIHRLQEYGKQLMEQNALKQIVGYFPKA